MKKFLVFGFLIIQISAFAQQTLVKGKVADKADGVPLTGATVILTELADTLRKTGSVADEYGNFIMSVAKSGEHRLTIEYLGYKTILKNINVQPGENDLGTIFQESATLTLKDVLVEGKQILVREKSDTTEYNANAFKANPDASAQDLISKMPGVSVENGTLKAHGENINKVLIDGIEFFGDDADLALKNLPADVIDKVQVFDRQSDQSQYTGFDDGNTQKTINIITKTGKVEGTFGKVYAGYGTDERYAAGGNINKFKGTERFSLLLMGNNINQQNFSSQDMAGLSIGGSQGRRGGGGGGGMRGGGGAENFMVGQQGGISTTRSLGLNYSNTFRKKLTVSASYFFSDLVNTNERLTKRNFFLSEEQDQIYNEQTSNESRNGNHRVNGRIEFKLDSFNTILMSPRISFQNNSSENISMANTIQEDSSFLNRTENNNLSGTNAFNLNNFIMYSHRFRKKGRSLTFNLNNSANNRGGDSRLNGLNDFNDTAAVRIINQRTDIETGGYTADGKVSYTEPVGKKGTVILNYGPGVSVNKSSRITKSNDDGSNEFTLIDTRLSSEFENKVLTHEGGAGYRVQFEKLDISTGLNYQINNLSGTQTYPYNADVERNFFAFLPNARLKYAFSKTTNLRMYYRSSTGIPSISQLQSVVDNSNPIQLSTGNPNLVQELSHSLFSRFSSSNIAKGTTFQVFIRGNYTNNYIGNSLTIADSNMVVDEGIVLRRGAQLSRPVNLDGHVNLNFNMSYGKSISLIKSNLNLNSGLIYNNIPGLINDNLNRSNNYTIRAGVGITSNISEKIDFNLNYSGNYNIVQNTIQTQGNNNYYYQTATFKINLMPWKGLVLTSDFTNILYTGLGPQFNRNFFLWNPAIGYKFLKNNSGELRISSFDLLNQNNSINRNITSNYVEDVRTVVLRRYFMVSFIFTLRNFPEQNERKEDRPY